MPRVYYVLALLVLALVVPGVILVVVAEGGRDGLPLAAATIRLTEDPQADLQPLLVVDAYGRATVLWQHQLTATSTIQLQFAQSPTWAIQPLPSAPLSTTHYAHLTLAAGEPPRLAWSQPLSETQAVFTATVRSVAPVRAATVPLDVATGDTPGGVAVLALDHQGAVHRAWTQGEQLHYAAPGITHTLRLSVPLRALTLTLGPQGQPHLAWSGEGPQSGIYYAALMIPSVEVSAPITLTQSATLSATLPLSVTLPLSATHPLLPAQPVLAWHQVSPRGEQPQVAVGPRGGAHLCWRQGESIFHAPAGEGIVPRLVVTEVRRSDAIALAVGPGEAAHLAWFKGGLLWYAQAADGVTPPRALAEVREGAALRMAIDARGYPHLAWAARDEKGNWDVYYLTLPRLGLQVQVQAPAGGATLSADGVARAETNLLASEVLRVEFYVQSRAAGRVEAGEALTYLGSDSDGRDGWSVPLPLAVLNEDTSGLAPRHRVLAIATATSGQVARAWGEWFSTLALDAPWVWLEATSPTLARGRASLGALALRAAPPLTGIVEARLRRLELFLYPLGCALDEAERGCALLSPSFYVGAYDTQGRAESSARWQRLAYDSRRLPDGHYLASVSATDRQGRRGEGLIPLPLRIRNAPLPSIEILSPSAGEIIRETLRVFARVEGFGRAIQRVDFYAEDQRPLLPTRYQGLDDTLEIPMPLWLGSDTDGTDGWGVRVPVSAALEGEAWRIRAVVFDEQGLANVAQTAGTVAILGRDRPLLRFRAPQGGAPLHDVALVEVAVASEGRAPIRVALYLETPDGALSWLGAMQEQEGVWRYAWETRGWPDGSTTLVAIAAEGESGDASGARSVVRSEEVIVANVRPGTTLEVAGAATSLSTTVTVCLRESAPPVALSGGTAVTNTPLVAVRFYLRDAAGQLLEVGQGARQGNSWCLAWETTQVLDGHYELLTMPETALGQCVPLTRAVSVRNETPLVAWRDFEARLPWRGPRLLSWSAQASRVRPALPLSLTLEYSPNGGAQWLEVARQLSATAPYTWNSAAYPDSAHALLRLTASDGVREGRAVSEMFEVNNVNEAPQVALFAPPGGTVRRGLTPLLWQAQDPDGDSLWLNLDYRRGGSPWVSIAQRLTNSGSYLWDTRSLVEGSAYELRLTAADLLGLTGSDVVTGLTLVANTPPQVRLLWPHGEARLQREAVILWQASDADRDALAIDLYYSDNAGQTWIPLAEGVDNTGYYVWQVSFLPTGAQYRIRVVARDRFTQDSDESRGVFAVGGGLPPHLALLAPALEQPLAGTQLLRWWAMDPARLPLTITLTLRAQRPPHLATTVTLEQSSSYLWDTRAFPDGEVELELVATNSDALSTTLTQPLQLANEGNQPPQVLLRAPRGGESWSGTREVLWQAWDQDGDVLTATLYLSQDDGRVWKTLARLDARQGRYLWDTTAEAPGRDCQLYVVVSDGHATAVAGTPGPFQLLNRRGYPPRLTLSSPDALGKLWGGNRIRWVAEEREQTPLVINLALSEDDGNSWRELARGLANTGEYILDTASLKPRQPLRVRVQADNGLYQTALVSPPFELVGPTTTPPLLQLDAPTATGSPVSPAATGSPVSPTATGSPVSPAATGSPVSLGSGERWAETREVRWRATDPLGQGVRVDIECSADGGHTWSAVARGLRNLSSYAWNTTSVANGTYFLRLTADNGQGSTTVLSEPFTVENAQRNAPVISLLTPPEPEVWWGVREVRWYAWDADGDTLSITLAYSLDQGQSWAVFATGVPNTGSYIWDTTTVSNCQALWLRATVSDGLFRSDDVGEVALAVRNPRAPTVVLLSPRGGEHWRGRQQVVWVVAPEVSTTRVDLDYSADAGRTWWPLASGLSAQESYWWDTATLAASARGGWWGTASVLLRVTASDGAQSGTAVLTQPLVIHGDASWFMPPLVLP